MRLGFEEYPTHSKKNFLF